MSTRQLSLRDLAIVVVVTILCSSAAVFVIGFTAAIHMPRWYLPFMRFPGHVAFMIWFMITAGLPNALAASLCAVTLASLCRAPARFFFAPVLLVWALMPFGFDYLFGKGALIPALLALPSLWIPLVITWGMALLGLWITLRLVWKGHAVR